MVAVERLTEHVGDPAARLAALAERWRLKPKRTVRWLRDLHGAFEQREPASCARYQRVAALGVEIARLLGLSPWSQAAIRGSALVAALARLAAEAGPGPRRRTVAVRGWEDEIRSWRWLQVCAGVLQGLRPGYDATQPLSRHGKEPPIESRVLALAVDFDELTAGEGGTPRMRTPEALHALRARGGQRLDARLVEILWSEAGQAACDNILRRRSARDDGALAALEASVRLLERGQPGPAQPVPREPPAPKAATAPAAPAASESEETAVEPRSKAPATAAAPAGSDGEEIAVETQPEEETKRSEEMSRSTTRAEDTAKSVAGRASAAASGAPGALGAHLRALGRELEEIRAAADRGLQALASVTPAMEELSGLVSRLQSSLLLFQNGQSEPSAAGRPTEPGAVEMRVELPGGALEVQEVVGALDNLPGLHDLHVRDRGPSWVVLRAQTEPDADLSILQAKVTGSLTRHLGAAGHGVEVSLTEAA